MRHPPGEDIFLEWRQRFGPIFTFWLGETPIVCIADYNKIVEYYQRGGEAFAGRHAIGNKYLLENLFWGSVNYKIFFLNGVN